MRLPLLYEKSEAILLVVVNLTIDSMTFSIEYILVDLKLSTDWGDFNKGTVSLQCYQCGFLGKALVSCASEAHKLWKPYIFIAFPASKYYCTVCT